MRFQRIDDYEKDDTEFILTIRGKEKMVYKGDTRFLRLSRELAEGTGKISDKLMYLSELAKLIEDTYDGEEAKKKEEMCIVCSKKLINNNTMKNKKWEEQFEDMINLSGTWWISREVANPRRMRKLIEQAISENSPNKKCLQNETTNIVIG